MEPLRAVPTVVPGAVQVHERNGGQKRGQADAFRQALKQNGGETPRDGEPRPGAENGSAADRQAAVRRTLQKQRELGRKDLGTARHVDVIA